MKKIIGGLRRNRNSIGSSSSTTDDAKISTPQEPTTTNEEVNYADLFDNDDDEDENCKENKINSRHISQKQRAKKKTIHKKRKKLNPQKLAAAASMKVMPMMTISEMADCEESTEDEKEGEGMADDFRDGDGHLVDENGGLSEEIYESKEINEERGEHEDVALFGEFIDEDEGALHDNSVAEEVETDDENTVDTVITSQEFIVVEEEQETIDFNADENKIVSSIDEDIENSVAVREEVTNEDTSEAVTHQIISDENVTQPSHHTNMNIRDDTFDYWSRMGLYTPSSFMQSLRIKYQVGLEGGA